MNDFKNIDNQLCDSDGIRTRTVIPDQGIFLPHLLLHKPTYSVPYLQHVLLATRRVWVLWGIFYHTKVVVVWTILLPYQLTSK